MFWTHHATDLMRILPFLGGWLADRLWADPGGSFHPVVLLGKLIASGEKSLNKGEERQLKGCVFALLLIIGTYGITQTILHHAYALQPNLYNLGVAVGVFFCLAGTTLIKEVKAVFEAVDRSTEEGRKQLSRIVGRDTSTLSDQEIRTAALESLAENLSDGVIAPMFWFLLLGLPGMVAYKTINTLDSMIGYKNERYLAFGRTAAQIDDLANYIPARLTAALILFVSGNWNKRTFVQQYGKAHASPNAGYPEAALAAVLDCRFGGTHDYFGKPVEKPYIGTNDRLLTIQDMLTAIQINSKVELVMGLCITLFLFFI
ncbi:cobalamin biosynthesis protein CobD [Parabacteroides sp. 52]|uniref:adenosylcobinamide-phosphate synthase CbiB n=1 Tax=unclassified Parabacteroides TaxID=2649774 RepID=UPI0013D30462|nr:MULTISPECIES: adenosylcobinamide-phosphate synthase CbiB [unclassified Parabacteroides]MDH6534298.1 adenosylcobinamide-phosphate synthase [Parabacteroides sp. PM5-20]NDV55319.1 cobalamin biosynthesis protein CobD [Parabacteroides sp. 52]